MQHQTQPWMIALVVLAAFSAAGCGGDTSAQTVQPQSMVFVCTDTGEVLRSQAQRTPAINPKTSRATLMPGLYCRKCEKWYPAPPAEVMQRVAKGAACPKTGWPLYANGPLPE